MTTSTTTIPTIATTVRATTANNDNNNNTALCRIMIQILLIGSYLISNRDR